MLCLDEPHEAVAVWMQHFVGSAVEANLGRGAVGAGHVDGLGAAVVAGLDVELDVLTLAQAAVAVGLDAGLRTGAEGMSAMRSH